MKSESFDECEWRKPPIRVIGVIWVPSIMSSLKLLLNRVQVLGTYDVGNDAWKCSSLSLDSLYPSLPLESLCHNLPLERLHPGLPLFLF